MDQIKAEAKEMKEEEELKNKEEIVIGERASNTL